ncbi:Crp/Fnr family transcriptional regulator [Niabella beijingensis]|uniref:Crp/Fnr family transcriptional regulator n=1 Tax=Niabella beijingensis TaxID=2872700 RepID=UPI001CBFAD90|nr:Crp/Fnr family transcriptional regulator [Niabella beijingensis]MBZ4190322.1 Crp/Fnr family transcriptional regulator [Niabella beijingensis]
MLRTNDRFLSYIETLYAGETRKEHFQFKIVPEGTMLLRQGSAGARVYVLKEGISKVFFSEDNGKEYILEFSGRGEIMGEIEVLRQLPCLCSVQALTEVQAYTISIPFFNALLEKDPQLNRLLLDVFAERIVNTSSRAAFQQLYTLEHSVTRLLEFQSKQQLQFSKEDMAAYLGITPRSLNRVLKSVQVRSGTAQQQSE